MLGGGTDFYAQGKTTWAARQVVHRLTVVALLWQGLKQLSWDFFFNLFNWFK